MGSEHEFDKFKKRVDRLYEKLNFSELKEIIVGSDDVQECRNSIDEVILNISFFGPELKNEQDIEWLYAIKKAFELRKFMLSEYYEFARYKKDNSSKIDNEHYALLINKALDRIKVLEAPSHKLNDFINVKELADIKEELVNERSRLIS